MDAGTRRARKGPGMLTKLQSLARLALVVVGREMPAHTQPFNTLDQ
jgi:hypothetical protein